MPRAVTQEIFVRLNDRLYQVGSYEEAARKFCAVRDRAGLGGPATPWPDLTDASGKPFGYISYNGRVWIGSPQTWEQSVCVFDPR